MLKQSYKEADILVHLVGYLETMQERCDLVFMWELMLKWEWLAVAEVW